MLEQTKDEALNNHRDKINELVKGIQTELTLAMECRNWVARAFLQLAQSGLIHWESAFNASLAELNREKEADNGDGGKQ